MHDTETDDPTDDMNARQLAAGVPRTGRTVTPPAATEPDPDDPDDLDPRRLAARVPRRR